MRYFSHNEPSEDGSVLNVATFSEDEIRQHYYPYWQDQMCKKFGPDHVAANYSFEDCLLDWKIVHWAWEVLHPTFKHQL